MFYHWIGLLPFNRCTWLHVLREIKGREKKLRHTMQNYNTHAKVFQLKIYACKLIQMTNKFEFLAESHAIYVIQYSFLHSFMYTQMQILSRKSILQTSEHLRTIVNALKSVFVYMCVCLSFSASNIIYVDFCEMNFQFWILHGVRNRSHIAF